ncbi:hypothetical protein [Streptomyces sp. NPDC057854]|uniref:nSTAND1 domain-containing NTPase n=1 Tax=unclassified Streptomyces TaxID=2593676 RepID=UPI00367F76DE
MGRRERPLDPADGPVEQFAYELRLLRQKAGGLTYRAMAARAHYSAAALAQAASGDRLATRPVVRAYVGACGGDPDEWTERWRQVSRDATERAAATDDPAGAPYLGLARFEPEDRELFFGRTRLLARLAALVRERRVIALVGPSGTGKSSLLRAGLIPALREEPGPHRPPRIHILTPGPHPARTHAHLLDAEQVVSGSVLMVDQFEELFTLCTDAAERTRFIDRLLAAVTAQPESEPGPGLGAESGPGSERGARLVIAVRADFFGHCAAHGPLAEAIRDTTQLVTPMSPDELREVVVRPAAARGLVVERSLTARVVRDLAGEPGGLPLLSHALRETWRRRHGRTLTEDAYEAAGGLHGALARTAEDFHSGLTPAQAATARRVLLRLVAPGRGTQDTRRPADRAEFETDDPDTALVLEQLARARLITLADATVDLAHEALLTAWPRLRGWIDEDRERLHTQRRLTEAADAWLALDRDAGALYRGVRLSTAAEHFLSDSDSDSGSDSDGGGGGPEDLAPLEREFLTASMTAHGRERRRRRSLVAVLCAVVVLALTAGLIAWQQNQVGERRRVEAEARRLAGVAGSLRLSDPRAAMRLGLAAWRLADLPETRSAVLSGMAQQELDVFTDPDGDPGTVRSLSSDGRTLTSVGRDRVTIRVVATGAVLRTHPGLGDDVDRVGLKRGDGDLVTYFPDARPGVGGETGGRVAVRDLSGRRPDLLLGPAAAGAEMSPSGRQVIAYDHTPTAYEVTVWDATTGRSLLELRAPRDADADPTGTEVTDATSRRQGRERRPLARDSPDVTVSPDGRTAGCVPGRPLELWDIARRKRSRPAVGWTSDRACFEERYQFVAGGRVLAHAQEGSVRLRDLAAGTELPPLSYQGEVRLGHSTDDRYVAAHTSTDVLLWRLDVPGWPVVIHPANGAFPAEPRADPATGRLRFLAGPERGAEPAVHTLDVSRAVRAPRRPVATMNARFSPDGRVLATADPPDGEGNGEGKGKENARFGIADGTTGRPIAALPGLPCRSRPIPGVPDIPDEPPCEAVLAFRPDGRELAYSTAGLGNDLRVGLWDLQRRRPVALPTQPPHRWTDIALVPDGRVAMWGRPSGIELWDPARGRATGKVSGLQGRAYTVRPDGRLLVTFAGETVRLPDLTRVPEARSPGRDIAAMEFSADSRLLAVGEGAGRVSLWDGGLERSLGVLTRADTGPMHVKALAFSPDGRTLAVAYLDGVVQLWDLDSRLPLGSPLPNADDRVHDLAFSSDGSTLYVAGARTSVQAIDVTPTAAAADICRRAGGGLDRREWQAFVNGLPYRPTC